MLNFITKLFSSSFEILLWLVLIGSAITGAIAGGIRNGFGYAILGLILGGVVGIVFILFVGGPLSIFVRLGAEVTYIKKHIEDGMVISLDGRDVNVKMKKQ